MAATTSKNDCNNDDETNDNMSDEEEWLERTNEIASQCPSLPIDTFYGKPLEFESRCVSYGDGGQATLVYPVWVAAHLLMTIDDANSNVREELLEDFYKLNEERKDFHAHPSPVEDIIDPDLLVYKPGELPLPPSVSFDDDAYDYDDADDDDQNNQHAEAGDNTSPPLLRDTYQWIPSEFRIVHNDVCEVHIETPISHLPMTDEYASTYRNLEKVFAKLVPMFGEIVPFGVTKSDTRLQVIVKVQSYNLQPRTKYSGRWHTEGRTENIQAVGVYYLYVDDELEGGALKLRPSVTPSKDYAECADIEINRYLMPTTDVAVVFANSLPHRFCSMRNNTSIARRRTFVNFFVVSPMYPIDGLSILELPLVSYEQCQFLLEKIEDEDQRQKLPDLVIEKILSFLKKNMWQTNADAKEFRIRARHEMLKEKSGWAGIHYGNSGDIVFINSSADWTRKNQQRKYRGELYGLEHTESD